MSKRLEMQLAPLLVAISVLSIACGGDGGGTQPPPGGALAVSKTATASGDAQSGTVGQPLANPIRVQVTENGSAASGVQVNWSTVPTGAGTMTPPSGATDADGVASSMWTLGTVSGAHSARAAVTGASGSPVTFSATAAPDAATSLSRGDGDAQSGVINTQLAAPVQAKVADQFGNGVPGVAVGWAATGATVSAATVATNATGISAVNVTLGGTAGQITITATSGTLTGSPLAFTATATAAPTTADISVVNNGFNPPAITVNAGTTVVWKWAAGATGHNVAPAAPATMPARSGGFVNAPASYSFKFDIPGTYEYYCENHGAPGFGMHGSVTVQ
jgi:plastocyanin